MNQAKEVLRISDTGAWYFRPEGTNFVQEITGWKALATVFFRLWRPAKEMTKKEFDDSIKSKTLIETPGKYFPVSE